MTELGTMEQRFAELIWENEPIPSGKLVALCAETLDWKKSTTYTVLKKLCLRGFFRNEDGVITSCISREDYAAAQSTEFVTERFAGSLPAFLAAFTRKHTLSQDEIDELQRLIDSYRG